MAKKFQMQARSSVDGRLYSWVSSADDRAGAGFTGPGSPLDVAVYSVTPSSALIHIACAILAPGTGAVAATGNTLAITGTISRPGSVVVYKDGVAIGNALVSGLTWSYSYALVTGDVGTRAFGAIATDAVNGTTASSTTVALTVIADHLFTTDLTSPYQVVQTNRGLTYGGTLLDAGGFGPVVTLSGALTSGLVPPPIWLRATSSGARGTWNYALYYDGAGTTPAATGISAATIQLPGAGSGLAINISPGIALTGNIWQATCAGLADQSGNGQDYWQAGITEQPVVTAGLGGKPGLLFDGINDALDCITLNMPNPPTTPWSFFAVLRVLTYVVNGRILTAGNDGGGLFWMHTNSPQLEIFNGISIGTSSGLAIGAWGAIDAEFAATAAAYLRAGSGAAQGFSSVGAGVGTGGRRIGAGTGGDHPANIELLALAYAPPQSAASFRASAAAFYGAPLQV